MPKVVAIPGIGNVEFPDDMSDSDIAKQAQIAHQSANQPKPSRKDSLKGGPANMPDDSDNPAREGFWKSLGKAVTAPFNFAANLDTVTPKDILEGAGNTIVKAGSGNLLGVAGDVAGGALVGSVLKGPSKAPEARAATRTAIMERMGVPDEVKPATPPTPAGGGLISNVRSLFDIYKKVKKLSPTALGEAGFERFLDFVEGQQEQPATPKPPAVPNAPIAEVSSPVAPLEPVVRPRGTSIPVEGPADPLPVRPAPKDVATLPVAEASTRLTPKPAVVQSIERTRPKLPRQMKTPEVATIPAPPPEFAPDVYAASARAAKATKLANLLHEHGISLEDAKLMEDAEWAQVSKAAGVRAPSAQSVTQALFELKQLEKKASNLNPKALSIAEELRDSMLQ